MECFGRVRKGGIDGSAELRNDACVDVWVSAVGYSGGWWIAGL